MKLKPREKVMDYVQRQTLSLSTSVTPFGCCDFFDACTEDIFSLSWAGRLPLLDLMGFNVTDECYKSVEFITYNRPEQSGGASTAGYLSDPCADPNGYELGSADLTVEDFGLIGRVGPTRDVRKQHVQYCATRPRVRLDGSRVTSEDEWDMLYAMDQILADVSSLLIVGNATTGGQFDGLQRWVSTQYDAMLDSWVVNWNSNAMAGGAGITINGQAIAATFDIVDVLLALFRRIRQRIGWSAMLRTQVPLIGDFTLVLPTSLTHCLLDFYTCWSVCEGQQYNEANLQTFEARTFRDGLIADRPENLFGHGFIRLDGVAIPLLAYDWELINSDNTFDMYFLTPSYGGFRIWEGQHLSASSAVTNASAMGITNGGDFFSSDGGRVLGQARFDNLCKELALWMSPRLFCYAPWMQMRFQNVQCDDVLDPLSPDPDTSYYPISSFTPAVCP